MLQPRFSNFWSFFPVQSFEIAEIGQSHNPTHKLWLMTFLDCVVKDANSDQEYSVIENQCSDVFVNTVMSPAFSSDAVNFSYTAFQFVANSDVTEALSMRLVCSVRTIFIPMTSWRRNIYVNLYLGVCVQWSRREFSLSTWLWSKKKTFNRRFWNEISCGHQYEYAKMRSLEVNRDQIKFDNSFMLKRSKRAPVI